MKNSHNPGLLPTKKAYKIIKNTLVFAISMKTFKPVIVVKISPYNLAVLQK